VSLIRNAEEQRLRALWRIVLQAAMMIGLGILPIVVIAEPLTALHHRGYFLASFQQPAYDKVINMMVGPLLAVAVIGSVVIARRKLDHRKVADLGIVFEAWWWRDLVAGFVISAMAMALLFAIEFAFGWVSITTIPALQTAGVSLGLAFSFTTLKVACVASYEEVYSRGYLLRNVADGLNLKSSVIVTSLVFALLHLGTPNASATSVVGLFVNGLFFAAGVLLTGRLSTSIGLHAGWNLFEGAVFGFPVSGDKEGASVIGIQQSGPELLTGGAYGPEAGVLGIVASLLGIAFLFVYSRSRWNRQGRSDRHSPRSG
jgi:membrane protease YdiL (CAAX protease family)